MKKTKKVFIAIGLILLAFSNTVIGQISIKHIGTVKGFEADYSLTKDGWGFDAGAFYYFNRKLSIVATYSFEKGIVGFTNYQQNMFSNKGYYNLYAVRDNLYFDVIGGYSLGGERINSSVESKSKKGFVMYGSVGARAMYYVNKNISVFTEIQENIGKSVMGNYYIKVNIGTRVLLNNINKRQENKKVKMKSDKFNKKTVEGKKVKD